MLLIRNTTLWTMEEMPPLVGDIHVDQNGLIDAIGPNLDLTAETIIDGTGLQTFPGLIDAHTHIGGMDFSYQTIKDDSNEMSAPVKPDARVIYSCNTRCMDLDFARRHGITTICITPGSGNVVNGIASVIKTYGSNISDMVMVRDYAFKIALRGNPKGIYGKRNQAPMTRMSIPTMIRGLFERGKDYYEDLKAGKKRDYDSELHAMLPVFDGKMPLKIHCTQYDMLTAIELAKEFGCKFSLEHAWGAKDYLEELVESGCSICFGPIGQMTRPGECSVIDIETAAELDKRGVLTAVITDAPLLSVGSLVQHVGEVVRAGLSPERAMAMATINPAKILGVDDRVGSLKVGKEGDIVIFDGVPAKDLAAKPVMVFGRGQRLN